MWILCDPEKLQNAADNSPTQSTRMFMIVLYIIAMGLYKMSTTIKRKGMWGLGSLQLVKTRRSRNRSSSRGPGGPKNKVQFEKGG